MIVAGPILEILTGDLSGRSFRVEDAEFVIGRAPSCDLVIPKRYISREHARITRAGADYVIDGLSETNPVLVKDRPARKGTRLADGDEFEVCGIRFRFRAEGEVAGRRAARTVVSSGSHHEDEGEQGSSWASDPGFQGGGAAKKSGARDPGPPSGDDLPTAPPRRRPDPGPPSDDDLPRGMSQDEETTDAPPRRAPPKRPAADDSDSGPVPAPKKLDIKASSKVVFDAEEDEDERTKELPKGKAGAASAPGSGSGDGNERTAELNKVRDPNDPDYDPFAEVDARKKKEKKVDPGREKAMRVLMLVGFVGIIVAAVVIKIITEPKPLTEQVHPTDLEVASEQVLRFEEPWSKIDQPLGVKGTNRLGEPYIIHRDNVIEVEWAVPHISTKCVFLIRGLEQGESSFAIQFPTTNRVKRFRVKVEGQNPHDAAREARRQELKKKSPRELKAAAEQHLASGDAFTKEREVPSKEGYYRRALLEYSRAADAALALRDALSQTGIAPPDVTELASNAEQKEQTAREDYDAFVQRELAEYQARLRRGAALNEVVAQLERLLRGLNHDCDVRFQRMRLILEECFNTRWTDPVEPCGVKGGS